MAETLRFLEGQDVSVIVCERDLPDGSWKDMLQAIGVHEHAPHLIVVSALADECLWSEVLNLGGYDVLLKPLNSSELFRVLSSAARSWRERRRAKQESALAVRPPHEIPGMRSQVDQIPESKPAGIGPFSSIVPVRIEKRFIRARAILSHSRSNRLRRLRRAKPA